MEDLEIERMAKFEDKYWWFEGRRKIILNLLEKYRSSNQNQKILDVGCGTGGTTIRLKRFGEVYGGDYSFSALQHSSKLGLKNLARIGIYDLPFPSETFDVITILDALEHIEHDDKVLFELKRILKKDGMILITVPAYQFLWSDHDVALDHYRRYNSKSISELLSKTRLEPIRISYMITFLFPLLATFRLLSKLKRREKPPEPTLVPFPQVINNLFKKILFLESRILPKYNLLFGLSIICLVKKSSNL